MPSHYGMKTPKKSHEPMRLMAQLLQNKAALLSYTCQFLHSTNMTRACNGNKYFQNIAESGFEHFSPQTFNETNK